MLFTQNESLWVSFVGPKIWFDISKNLKYFLPYLENNLKQTCYLARFPSDFCLYACHFLQYCVHAPLFPPIIYLYSRSPHLLDISMLFPCCFFVVFCLFYLSSIRCILLLFYYL